MKKYVKPALISILALNLTQCASDIEKIKRDIDKWQRESLVKKLPKEYPSHAYTFTWIRIHSEAIYNKVIAETSSLVNKTNEIINGIDKQPTKNAKYTNEICGHTISSTFYVGKYITTPNYCINPKYTQEMEQRANRKKFEKKRQHHLFNEQIDNIVNEAIHKRNKLYAVCDIISTKKDISDEFIDIVKNIGNVSIEQIKQVGNKLENNNDKSFEKHIWSACDRDIFYYIGNPSINRITFDAYPRYILNKR